MNFTDVLAACSTHEKDEKYKKNWLENLKKTEHSEDLGVDGRKC
jgi:hypothetical protein